RGHGDEKSCARYSVHRVGPVVGVEPRADVRLVQQRSLDDGRDQAARVGVALLRQLDQHGDRLVVEPNPEEGLRLVAQDSREGLLGLFHGGSPYTIRARPVTNCNAAEKFLHKILSKAAERYDAPAT